MSDTKFDVIVIGGGPGGYVASIRAAQLGMKVAVVEKEHLGGICLNWGCIPTKALLRTSEIYSTLSHVGEFGIEISGLKYDLKKMVQRSRKVAKKLSAGVIHLLKKNKVTLINGHGKLDGRTTDSLNLTVLNSSQKAINLTSKNIVLATGARARSLPGINSDLDHIWTYKEAMVPEALPSSLLVIGSGAIGIEFASFYSDLGTSVTVVEVMDRILPIEDKEISTLAEKAFIRQGINIKTSAKVSEVKVNSAGAVEVDVECAGKTEKIVVEKVILAVGIIGNTEELGIENTNVEVKNGHIVIDERCATGEQGIYAIGDIAGPPWLAHKASHEGIICIENIAGLDAVHPINVNNIPGCTYCRPQIASVGMTEESAMEAGYQLKIGRFPFMANGKAIALGESEGLVKTVFDSKTGELLGAHMIGAEVTEMIQGYAMARTLETTEAELMQTIFPHPTLSEMMHESVLDAYGKVIHF